MAIDQPALGPLLGSAVNTVISPFYTLFSTNATYCFTARMNVTNHRTETETLEGKVGHVEETITEGHRNGLILTVEAEKWLQRAKQAISEEAANRESFGNRCRIFGCSLNCWGNYKTSKLAAEKVKGVRNCISSTPVTGNITRIPPPPPVVDLSTQSVQLLPSRKHTLQNTLRCITDDLAVGVIGIWGPDRDDKTHLLKKINDSFLGGCPFDFVIFVTASSECSVQNIQAQIVNRLRINDIGDVATQATRISELLKTKSFLLLVDDLCEKLDLSAVGIPYPLGVVDQKNRKVLIMSRSQSVCDLMGVDKYIEVLGLEEEEACQLFEQTFGEENLYDDPLIGVLAKDLVRELMGLPSELIHFGKIMRRSRNARQWEDVIDAVKRSNRRKDNPLCMAEKIVESLEDSTKDLVARRNDVCHKIENAEREGKKSTNEVDRWLEKVAKSINDVQVISVDCKLKKDVTMEASEKLLEVQQCLLSCPYTYAVESMPAPVQEMPGPSMSVDNANLKMALQYIKDDDPTVPTVGIIGIWGPGGVGKTHLLNNINNSLEKGMPFNFVLFVTASRGCSVEKVQSQIIERFRLQIIGSKRLTIHEYMKTKSFLVLLDDVWNEINLEEVGIPYPLGNVNKLKRKVVLTTRSRNVCGQMKVRKELKVSYLQEQEAWQLFEENVGAETLSSPHIEDLARELMKELKGLPLALITVGKAMYRKDTDQWKTAIQYMQRPCCTDDKDPVGLDMGTKVFRQLKFSYDNLRNKTLRDCFLTCALWPEDEKIHKVDLAQCWMGLGLVNEQEIESSFRTSYSLIADLTSVCLLEDCEDLYGSVKVHDLIRDMALWISCDCGENNDKWIVPAPVGKDKKIIIPWKTEYISLMSNRVTISLMSNRVTQLVPIEFNCYPMKLRILCLRNNYLNESVIAEAIKNCTSLTYLDLRGNELKMIPEELCSLRKLEYLDLSRNKLRVTEVPHCFGNLISLKFLYLMSTGIRTIPIKIMSSLKELQVIDLRTLLSMENTHKGPANFIHEVFRELRTLSQLKALGIETHNFAEFESLREVANVPIRYLNLKGLEKGASYLFDILSNEFAQRTLCELNIERCHSLEQIIVRQRQPNNHFGALNKLRMFLVTQVKEITWMGVIPASIFPWLTHLELLKCHSLRHLSWVMYLPRLEQLRIADCLCIVQAFMRCHGDELCNGQEKTKTFPCLKFLSLSMNFLLHAIGDNGMEFPSLERLVLDRCPNLKRIPFRLDSLPLKLKELRCDDVQCWERLECEEGVKTLLEPALKFGIEYEYGMYH